MTALDGVDGAASDACDVGVVCAVGVGVVVDDTVAIDAAVDVDDDVATVATHVAATVVIATVVVAPAANAGVDDRCYAMRVQCFKTL